MSITEVPAVAPVSRRSVTLPLEDVSLRESGSGDGTLHLTGHAAVFDRLSHDLGGFRERIARGAFTDVLDQQPAVHLVYGHDMNTAMASTEARTLELREDPQGLRVWAQLDPEDFDVRRLVPKMRRGDIRQMSFAFMVGDDTWDVENVDTPDERVVRTVRRVSELFDVSVVAQGAYPQTDASLRSLLDQAIAAGRVPMSGRAATGTLDAAPTPVEGQEPPSHPVGGHSSLTRLQARVAAQRLLFTRRTSK